MRKNGKKNNRLMVCHQKSKKKNMLITRGFNINVGNTVVSV